MTPLGEALVILWPSAHGVGGFAIRHNGEALL
jgi:hypothetical protein